MHRVRSLSFSSVPLAASGQGRRPAPPNVYLVIIDERRVLAIPYYHPSNFARFPPKIISRQSSGRPASSSSFR
jgi:hypothetical protein